MNAPFVIALVGCLLAAGFLLTLGSLSPRAFAPQDRGPDKPRYRLDQTIRVASIVILYTLLSPAAVYPYLEPQAYWQEHRLLSLLVWCSSICCFALLGLKEERHRLESPKLLDAFRVTVIALKLLCLLVIYLWSGIVPTLALLIAFLVIALTSSGFLASRQADQLKDAESAAWRSRLAPHFVFNVLNGLQAQIPKDPGGAQATTEHLGRLFRQLIHLSQRPTVPLSDELAFVEDLLALHRARLGDRLEVALDIPEDTEDLELPTLALQILVENALKHGIEGLERGGRISILAKRDTWYEGDGPRYHLLLEVTNPVAPHRQIAPNGTGTGLASLRARLQRPEDLEIHQTDDHFTVRLRWRQP